MKIVTQRRPTVKDTTFGDTSIDGEHFCYTLEDAVRPSKVKGCTAIPPFTGQEPCTYRVTLESSPRFGPRTITLNGVEQYIGVRVHGGRDDQHTEGCPIVGTRIVEDPDGDGGDIRGWEGILPVLKDRIEDALSRFDNVTWTFINPPTEERSEA